MTKSISATLIDHMGDDLTVVNAARVSYAAESKVFNVRDEALIKFLAVHGHVTPFRHPQISLRCRAPIFLARQLGKHQTGFSWNEISRRYKDGEAVPMNFYVPETVFARPNKLMTETAAPMDLASTLVAHTAIQAAADAAYHCYSALIEFGVAPEQARMVLPQSMVTEWIWTGSLYGWASLYKQRSTEHAQYEARLFADEIDEIMSKLYPVCWAALTAQE